MKEIKNFRCDDRVEIFNFPDGNKMNNATGTILGMGYDVGPTFGNGYIVLLDIPLPDKKAILITEACLKLTNR